MARLAWFLFWLMGLSAAHAEVDIADYGTKQRLGSAREQAQIRAQIATERALEAERERGELAQQQAWLAEQRRTLAARPYPARLTEARCTGCHVAQLYVSQRHGWLGWTMVSLRMKYLNGASDMAEAERAVIVDELAAKLPVSLANALLEYLAAGAVIVAPLASIGMVLWLLRKKKSMTGTSTIPENKNAHR